MLSNTPGALRAQLLSVAACGALVVGCGGDAGAAEERKFDRAKEREPARVLVQPVAQREMVRRLETTTRVESEHQVQVYPRASGIVTELVAEEGRTVVAEELLAQIDKRDAELKLSDSRAALDEARANVPKLSLSTKETASRKKSALKSFEQAERDHARNSSIARGDEHTPGLISSKDLEASELAVDRARMDMETADLAHERAVVEEQNGQQAVRRAELAVERAQLELSFLSITAPIAGVVAERSIKVGDTVGPANAAFVITDPQRLRAIFYRPQRELPLFRPAAGANGDGANGATAELEIRAFAEALPGKEFRGRIERVAPTIDAASGNFRVTARLEATAHGDPHAKLLPGMLVRIEIVTERHPGALVVPKRAVRREGDRNRIFLVRDGHAHGVDIEELFSDDLDVEVRALRDVVLAAGDQVVVVGNRELEDGAPVQLVATEAAPAQ